jgi:2-methylisocitrate lyase-like PEP mutase family enzyme
MSQATKLRERIREGGLLVGVGACNALEARLIENAGFDFVWASGFAISASHALPDASIISMTELLEATRAISGRINIPVVADCDTGFGNANDVPPIKPTK